MRKFFIVGLTGPTGAGKSTVSKVFARSGYAVINADEIAKKVIAPGSVCVTQLVLAFGRYIMNPNGTINRKRLAEKAFASPSATQLLNDITHPQIFLMTMRRCREAIDSGSPMILFDAPVLFESGSEIMCDAVVSVVAPKELRIERLTARDSLPREAIEKRMSAQHPDQFYTDRSDYVINGGADFSEVKSQTEEIIKLLAEEYAARLRTFSTPNT